MKNYDTSEKLSIKNWAEDDRPREKLLAQGRQALTDAELIAILIGSGNSKETAVDLSRRILADNANNLNTLAQKSVKDLCQYLGIGEAKAISIVAALELGRRRKNQDPEQVVKIGNSQDIYQQMYQHLADLPHEEFWLLHLNRANRLIEKQQISIGGVAGTVVDVKIVLKAALDKLSSGVVLCHNHPSGNLVASKEDLHITKKIQEACLLLDIRLIDHLIFSNNGYYSFMDEGML